MEDEGAGKSGDSFGSERWGAGNEISHHRGLTSHPEVLGMGYILHQQDPDC